jgi:23S rRNA (adenine2503-C2)-methyltransferase
MSAIQLKNLTLPQLEEFVLSIGEAKFRALQIFKWIYQKRFSSFDSMTNMPKNLRVALSERASIDKLVPVRILESSLGDAVKFGFALVESPHIVESVLLIDGVRRTACVSSQLGCGLGCVFCETAKLGFVRNLTQAEIIGQIVGINDYLAEKGDKPVTNVVFMGMGEALGNFENFRSTLDIIMHEGAFCLGARRITVSTAGVIPYIERLIGEDLSIGLAISLNAWNNEMRSAMMPINRTYPIERLTEVARRYHGKTGRRVTFEYILIEGETDTRDAAEALQRLLGGFPCKINLIPVNAGGNKRFTAPNSRKTDDFAEELHKRGLSATIRRSRGQDIFGACGQLAGEYIIKKN